MRLRVEDNGDKVPARSNPAKRLPFNEAERLEIGARQFVFSRLPLESQYDLEMLVGQLIPSDECPVDTPIEFGKRIAKSSDQGRLHRGV
jgi:hypothetical protein